MLKTVQVDGVLDAPCSCGEFCEGGGSASDTNTEPVYLL
jgi:hypothetical protein